VKRYFIQLGGAVIASTFASLGLTLCLMAVSIWNGALFTGARWTATDWPCTVQQFASASVAVAGVGAIFSGYVVQQAFGLFANPTTR
jgi:hypothetical protein